MTARANRIVLALFVMVLVGILLGHFLLTPADLLHMETGR